MNELEQWTFINVSSWRGALARFDRGFPLKRFYEIIFSLARFSASWHYQSAAIFLVPYCHCRCSNAKENYIMPLIASSNKAAQPRKSGIIGSRCASSGDLVILSIHDPSRATHRNRKNRSPYRLSETMFALSLETEAYLPCLRNRFPACRPRGRRLYLKSPSRDVSRFYEWRF